MISLEKIMEYRNENNRFASYLGIRTTEIQTGYAKGEMHVKEYFKNAISSVHGGCIFALADTIGGAAAVSYGYKMTTISSDFHYLSPAMDLHTLIAEAKEIKRGKKISIYDVAVSSEDGKLLAKGTFSYYNLGIEISFQN